VPFSRMTANSTFSLSFEITFPDNAGLFARSATDELF
jgi:hypothetical protein